ncbi:hypothetical protein [Rhizobium sp. R634]|uniref:hypothetical protein n=1 Tax=Rhizobium sp. R634 TaxID=1764274 RepID=UPI00167C808B|nr:hypothetical protein [Rhizobium sp. R634]
MVFWQAEAAFVPILPQLIGSDAENRRIASLDESLFVLGSREIGKMVWCPGPESNQ